jgi:hypothetical protein
MLPRIKKRDERNAKRIADDEENVFDRAYTRFYLVRETRSPSR